jgi:hypothetical protein
MDLPAGSVVSASLGASDIVGTAVFVTPTLASLGGFPVQSDSFAVISTGGAANAFLPNLSNSLSTVLSGLNTSEPEDLVQLTLTLNVPPTSTHWAVNWKFFSEEFPEFVGSAFNDAFLIETPSSSFTLSGANITAPNNVAFDPSGALVTVNTTGAVGMTSGNAAGTTYDGATEKLTTVGLIPPGASTITLVFSVMDLGDSIYDTTVFLDNFRFVSAAAPTPVQGGSNEPPVIDVPPSPAIGTEFSVAALSNVTFTVQASDPDAGDEVVLDAIDLPSGATLTGSPTGTFSWTPSGSQTGVHIITFTAIDQQGKSSQPHQIVVVVGPTATPTPIPGLSVWGLLGLAGLMAVVVLWRFRRTAGDRALG